MLALARIATEYSKTILLLLLVITLGFASQLRHLHIDDDILNMIPADHPARLLQEHIEQQFGLRDLVILAIENPQGAFNVESLARIKSLSDYLQSLPEIIAEDVTSLTTTDNIIALNDELFIRPPLTTLPENNTDAEDIFQEIKDNPLFINHLVSADAKVIAIFAPLAKNTTRRSVYEQVNQHLAQLAPARNGDQILVSGNVMIEGALGYSMRSDLRRLGPVIIVVLLLLLSIYFKHFKLAILPILTAIISVIWTMGLLSLFKIPVYLPTTLIPVMLLVIGITDEVHLISIYKNLGLKEARKSSLLKALKHIIRPISLTSITTGAGFVALSLSPILPLKHFGLFTAFGIAVAYLLTFSLTPAFLSLMRRPKGWAKVNTADKKPLRIWVMLSQLQAKAVAISLLFIGLAIAWGASGIRVDENWVNRFKADTVLYKSDAKLNQALGGTSMLYGYITSAQGTLKNPQVLQSIEQLQQAISKLDNVGKVTSIIDLLKRSNRVLNNDDPHMEVLPSSEQAIAQQLLLLESSGDPNDLDVWIDNQQQRALLWIQIKDPYASTTRQILPQLEQLVKQHIPELKVYFGGPAQVNVAMADMVVSSQLSSLSLSFMTVFVVLLLIYRSLSWALLAMLPLTIALLSIFAILALTDRYIDIPLAILASISLGLAVDYAIYVLDRYRKARLDDCAQSFSQQQAVQISLSQSGHIIVFSSLILATGFSILVLSLFAPLTAIGLLTAGVLLISALISLFLPLMASSLTLRGEFDNEK